MWGEAIEVPEMVLVAYLLPIQVERMLEAGGEDVGALAVVGEVGAAVVNGRGADGDGLLGGGGRVVAGVGVVVAGSDGEVDASGDGGVDGVVESAGSCRHRATCWRRSP